MDVINSGDRMVDLLDGGQHMDDHAMNQRRKYRYKKDMPCNVMLTFFMLMITIIQSLVGLER